MNILIVDTDKYDFNATKYIYDAFINPNESEDDYLVIPKDFSVMMDVSVDWMKMIRDRLDDKIKSLEYNNTK